MGIVALTTIVELVSRANDVRETEARELLRIPLQQLGYSPTATRLVAADAVELLERLGSGVTVFPPAEPTVP